MQESIKLIIGIVVILLGIPIGDILAHYTKEELKQGSNWFKRTVIISLLGALAGLIIGSDVLLFSCAFISIVTSRSLKRPGKQRRIRK